VWVLDGREIQEFCSKLQCIIEDSNQVRYEVKVCKYILKLSFRP